MSRAIRCLIVSHAMAAPGNRDKLAHLPPDIDWRAIFPANWFRDRESQAFPVGDRRILPLPVTGAERVHRHRYSTRQLIALFREWRPTAVLIEEEPTSLAALQVAALSRLFRVAGVALFTWENTEPPGQWARRAVASCVLRLVDRVVVGNAEAGTIVRRRGFRGPIDLGPQLGVEPDQFAPCPTESACRATHGLAGVVVGYVGRLVPQKGLAILMDAVARVPEVGSLLIVGDGPEREPLERLATRLGIADRTVWVGAQPYHRVPWYLHATDIFVLPSVTVPGWKEQFGHVLIEAMSCGVATVGSASGAIPEVIGSAGLTFPEGDAAALAAILSRLATRPAERRALAERGRARVLHHYTNARIARANADIFRVLAR